MVGCLQLMTVTVLIMELFLLTRVYLRLSKVVRRQFKSTFTQRFRTDEVHARRKDVAANLIVYSSVFYLCIHYENDTLNLMIIMVTG